MVRAARIVVNTTGVGVAMVLACGLVALARLTPRALSAQGASASRPDALPPDIHPGSRNRLPPLAPDVTGVATIRLHVPPTSDGSPPSAGP